MSALNVVLSPIPYVALAAGFFTFAPDVGHLTPLFQDAAKLCGFLAAFAYNPSAILQRLGVPAPSGGEAVDRGQPTKV